MLESLILIAVIVGVAWLIDRGWAAWGNRPRTGNQNAKIAEDTTRRRTQNPSAKLRGDWLRLGRRSK